MQLELQMQITLHQEMINEYSIKHAVLYGLVEVWFKRLAEKGIHESYLPMEPFRRYGFGGTLAGRMFTEFCNHEYLYRIKCPKVKTKWLYSRYPIEASDNTEEAFDGLR